jgi:hypothetical protein
MGARVFMCSFVSHVKSIDEAYELLTNASGWVCAPHQAHISRVSSYSSDLEPGSSMKT